MNRYRIFSLWTLLLLLVCMAGCSDEEVAPSKEGGKVITLTGEIDQVAVSRANDNGFCDGDAIGVYVVDYNGNNPGKLAVIGNRANNMCFTFNETAYRWNSDRDIYWKDGVTHIDVYGYYPYGSSSSVDACSFEVKKDQSTTAGDGLLGGYEASDFLWGKATDVAPTASVVRLSFKHRMANVRIALVEGTGFASSEWAALEKQVLVTNTKRKAVVNLMDGSVTATDEVSTTGTIPSKVNDDFRAIVVPQTVAAAKSLFSITVGRASYQFTKEEVFTYVSGKMHNFSIVVNKKTNTGDFEFVVAGESITAWENDLVSHDAIAREYVVVNVPEAGTLKECIVKAGLDHKQLQDIKVTGRINENDFTFMRENMSSLRSLNLKNVQITEYGSCEANKIPAYAFFQNRTLLNLVLPDKLVSIGSCAFKESVLNGSLVIPEGVVTIEYAAFEMCSNLTGSLVLPTTLQTIGAASFAECNFVCELILPTHLKTIDECAFLDCEGFYGELILPEALEKLGRVSFYGCRNLSGSLTIPRRITEIPEAVFTATGLNGNLILHDKVALIGKSAFLACQLKGELVLPQSLIVVEDYAFSGCKFSGELKLPKDLLMIGQSAFEGSFELEGIIEIPERVMSIGASTFSHCKNIKGVVFPAGLESIQREAFAGCYSLGSIVCKGAIPPYIESNTFGDISKDNFTLEVPETSVLEYKMAPGWNEFKRIAAHHELECRPSMISAINTRSIRSLILYAEGDWEVESKPSWCTLSNMSGSKKTELTLTVEAMSHGSGNRTGEVVFKLKGKDYTTSCTISQYDYEYDEDKIITLQSASKGKGINLIFLGDGYNAEDVSTGKYLSNIKEQVEHFFTVEPYSSYRNYFNVYTAIALSPESGIGTVNTLRDTKFETTFSCGTGLIANNDAIFEYALKMPTVTKNNLNQSLIVVTPNTTEYGGVTQMWSDGSAIAFCPRSTYGYPYDARGLVQHEAGGHGFGKLGDEYIYQNGFVNEIYANMLRGHQARGWFQNLSLTGKMHEVPWSHLMTHSRYSGFVDIFEGGLMFSRGVFRSEQNSCMNNNIPYFSTISREVIVKRIMEYAGEQYTFEKFVANDKTNAGSVTRADALEWRSNPYGRQDLPRIHPGSPAVRK